MEYLKRLRIKSKFDRITSLLIYISIETVLLLISISYPIIFIFYLLLLLYLFFESKPLFYYSLLTSLFFLILFIISYYYFKNYSFTSNIKGIVTYKDDNYILVKNGLNYIKVYFKNIDGLEIGNKVSLKINKFNTSERNLDGIFSYYKYKLSKRIIAEGKLVEIKEEVSSFNIYYFKRIILNYIDNNFSEESNIYLKKLILGVSSFDNDLNESINNLGIIYLYSISGLHINIMVKLIRKGLSIFNIEEEIINIFIIIVLFVFIIISNGSSSIKRSSFSIILQLILSFKNKKISKTDILSYSIFFQLLSNPLTVFDVDFYFTNLTTFILLLDEKKNSINVLIYTIPLLLFKNSKLSIFVFLFSVIFDYIFSSILIPLSYLTFLVFPIDIIYSEIIKYINYTIELLNKYNVYIHLSINNIFIVLLIYLLLFLICKNKTTMKKKYLYLKLLSFIFINLIFSSSFNLIPKITFLDVDQGDSAIIKYGFKTFLIDTGNLDSYNTLEKYLSKHNINKIDYLFISHFDCDHSGVLDDIKDNFYVDNIIYNTNDFHYKYRGLFIKSFYTKNKSENDSSMVLFVNIYNKKILFTGDIENKGEEDLMDLLDQKIDILKVSHHGSNSSTSKEFLNKYNPSYCIISVGENNTYNHPSSDVIERINDIGSIIYRTDICGSIEIKLYYNCMIFSVYNNKELGIINMFKYKRIKFS